jgi:hypothetical protein
MSGTPFHLEGDGRRDPSSLRPPAGGMPGVGMVARRGPAAPETEEPRFPWHHSRRHWYLAGALLSGGMLLVLFNPTLWAVSGFHGWPHELFMGGLFGTDPRWGDKHADAVFFAVCAFSLFAAFLLPPGRIRGAIGIAIGALGISHLAPSSTSLVLFLAPVGIGATLVGAMLPREAGQWRERTLLLGIALLVMHAFFPLARIDLETRNLAPGYHSTAGIVVDLYADPPRQYRPDTTGTDDSAPDSAIEGYLLLFLHEYVPTMSLLVLALGVLAWLGVGGAVFRAVCRVLLGAFVLGALVMHMANGWQVAGAGALSLSPVEGALQAFGTWFHRNFLILLLPAAAGVADMARARMRFTATPGRAL